MYAHHSQIFWKFKNRFRTQQNMEPNERFINTKLSEAGDAEQPVSVAIDIGSPVGGSMKKGYEPMVLNIPKADGSITAATSQTPSNNMQSQRLLNLHKRLTEGAEDGRNKHSKGGLRIDKVNSHGVGGLSKQIDSPIFNMSEDDEENVKEAVAKNNIKMLLEQQQIATRQRKEAEARQREPIERIESEKKHFKLIDYFVTVGIDNYHQDDEIYRSQDELSREIMQQESRDSKVEERQKADASQVSDFELIDETDDGEDFDRVVSKIEIFTIRDKTIFDRTVDVGGVPTNFRHPSTINEPNEKWVDLRGDQSIYLKVTFDKLRNCKKPITDLNFYKISKYQGQPNKMQIHVRQGIEPIPVKVFGDPDANEKFHKTKKLGKNGNKNEDMYNFYGDYDLTDYFEPDDGVEPQEHASRKNLCLCQSTKKQQPIADVILVIGKPLPAPPSKPLQSQTINWEVPEGYRKLAYSVGTNGVLNRLLCLRSRDLSKRRIKARVLDHCPKSRHYYALPTDLANFCFPQGIQLQATSGQPEFFNFSIMSAEGSQIFGSCLVFDEEPSRAFKEKLKYSYYLKPAGIRVLKCICLLSHHSFGHEFKEILKLLYRKHLSSSRLPLPLERYIFNLTEEIPLPDEAGKILVQHELGGHTVSFFRPVDQNAPFIDKTDIDNLFRVLSVENVIEIFSYLLCERKVVVISQHKALLTQVINCLVNFLYPVRWQHTMIPILPLSMIDVLDAPFPYLAGVQPHKLIDELGFGTDERYENENEVLRVDLDRGQIMVPNIQMTKTGGMPQLPISEYRQLKQRLQKATESVQQLPDQMVLATADLAFHRRFEDPEEEEDEALNHLEIRDSFLEFMSSLMSGYTKYLKDPGDNVGDINQNAARDFFDMDKFRLHKDAKKAYTFLYKFTDTVNFNTYIEGRCIGMSKDDQQIMHFEKLLTQKRTLMRPRLIHPFAEQKSVTSNPPYEEDFLIAANEGKAETFSYKIFPQLNSKYYPEARPIPDFNKDAIFERTFGSPITSQELLKMHDNEYARYMLETIYLLWFQIFCTALPIYGGHAPALIDFARRLLQQLRSKLKPMRDIEIMYRRLFEACGSCKQISELKEIYDEMKKGAKVIPDKVTSGTYYQALLQCKRRAGEKEAEPDKRRSYFQRRMEDYHDKLSQSAGGQNAEMRGRMSGVSGNSMRKQSEMGNEEIASSHHEDFGDFLERGGDKNTDGAAARASGASQSYRLSAVLESFLLFEVDKQCAKCHEPLREEELLSGFEKNLSNYTVKCPVCKKPFVPKFTIYAEQETPYLPKGRDGENVSLLPPITLYKEFFNILVKEGADIAMSEALISEHRQVFWNLIFYFKILKLPNFMLDLDYSPAHQKQHCQTIRSFLPVQEKSLGSIFGRKNSSQNRSSTFVGVQNGGIPLPQTAPKLDSNALKMLNNQQSGLTENSPMRLGFDDSSQKHSQRKIPVGPNQPTNATSNAGGGRPSSLKRVAGAVFSLFSSSKKNSSSYLDHTPEQQQQRSSITGGQGGLLPPKVAGGQPATAASSIRAQMMHAHQQQKEAIGGMPPMKGGSQAGENERKSGGLVNLFKKATSSNRSGGKGAGSQRSGPGSAVTSLSDLEKIEKIMNEAAHASKSIVKYFGKHFEEFRREMHYNKEVIFQDVLIVGDAQQMPV